MGNSLHEMRKDHDLQWNPTVRTTTQFVIRGIGARRPFLAQPIDAGVLYLPGSVADLPTTPTEFLALQDEPCDLVNWLVPVDEATDSWLLIGYGTGNNICNPMGPNSGPIFFPLTDPFFLGPFTVDPASEYTDFVMTVTLDNTNFAVAEASLPEPSELTMLALALLGLAAGAKVINCRPEGSRYEDDRHVTTITGS